MNPGTSQLTDAALVQGALGDDDEAFGHLYRRFHPRLVRLVARKTGDRLLAEDVAQEALLRALDKLDTFDRSRPLWPWLRAIATNLVVDVGRKRSREVEWDPGDAAEVAAPEAPSCEDGMVLAQLLKNLPDRQRVAVSLRYLQDWESSEAASLLGLSIPAFEQLLFRARKRLRLEYSRISQGALGLFGAPGQWLRRLPGTRRAVEVASQMGPATWAQAAAGGLALLTVLPSLPMSAPSVRDDGGVAIERAGEDRVGRRRDGGGSRSTSRGGEGTGVVAAAPIASDAPAPAAGPGDSGPDLKDVTEPTRDVAQPEDATITSVAFAPESRGGKRAFAVGDPHCGFGACDSVLFTSGDGGTSWRRLPAHGLSGHTVLVPPGSDGTKLFAMGPMGLQVSTDAGRTFTMAALTGAPVTGAVAVSPAFDRGDPTMLIGARTLLRYDDSTATIGPEPSTTLTGPFEPVFSPSYPADPRFVLGGVRVDDGELESTVFTCNEAMCLWSNLHGGAGAPKIRLTPGYERTNVAFAFTGDGLYRSDDVWGFTRIETPWPAESWLRDVALIGSGETLWAAVHSVPEPGAEGLYRSGDGGETWTEVASPLFERGAASISVAGRRIVVALPERGLACSSDGGRHWARRC